jgi:undecaprenyl-diphosphatase
MTIIQSVLLGLAQGLTEFLPVSSSAHLVIIQHLFGLKGDSLLVFDIVVHVGTLSAVLVYFAKDLFPISKIGVRTIGLVCLAMVPTGIIGLLLHKQVELFFSSLIPVAVALMINSAILWSTRFVSKENLKQVSGWLDALWIGIVQGIAVIPGISRSGSTISAALWRKMKAEDAAKFSFFLAIPAILAALALKLKDTISLLRGGMWPELLVGFFAAFLSGYAAIFILFRLLAWGRFHYFAIYTFCLSILTFVFSLLS